MTKLIRYVICVTIILVMCGVEGELMLGVSLAMMLTVGFLIGRFGTP